MDVFVADDWQVLYFSSVSIVYHHLILLLLAFGTEYSSDICILSIYSVQCNWIIIWQFPRSFIWGLSGWVLIWKCGESFSHKKLTLLLLFSCALTGYVRIKKWTLLFSDTDIFCSCVMASLPPNNVLCNRLQIENLGVL